MIRPLVNALRKHQGVVASQFTRTWQMSPRGVRATPYRLSQTLGSLSLGGHWLNQIPILYTVLEFVLIIGVIYYYAAARRHPEPILPPAETGAFVIPRESLPPDEIGPQ
jgi:hypothetical protein